MEHADLVVTDARVYTADPTAPWADAFAVRAGRFAEVGTRSRIERRKGPRTEVLDAAGRLVLPGFVDAHVHLIWGYELGSWIDLTGRPTLADVTARVRAYAQAHPDEEILIGHGFDYAALKADGLPTKEDLDDAVPDRPVVLTAWDGHTGWGNTLFVRRAKEILRDAGRDVGHPVLDPRTREPTGIFLHTFDLTRLMPEVARRRSLDGLRQVVGDASRFGITTAFDVQVGLDDLAAYEALREKGALDVRVRIALYHPEDTTRDRYAAFLEASRRLADDALRVAAVKLYIDGVQETGTAALLEPYADNPASSGSTVYPEDRYRAIVAELDRLGFQICTHACGDRGVRIALDAYGAAARSNGTSGRRHRIEHCENLSARDIPRFAALGVIPCMMPRHASPELTGRWRTAIGPERTRIAFPWRALLDARADLAFASDWPVAELNPLVGIAQAVGRLTPEGEPSPHRVTRAEAIDGYTRRAAFASAMESTVGSIAPGKHADFIVLAEDLFDVPVDRIATVTVLRTVVGGRTVHPMDV
jgi:hypothetical protein